MKLLLIGSGWVALNRHIPCLIKLKNNLKLNTEIHVFNPSKSNFDYIQKKFNGIKLLSTEFPDCACYDFVLIATPPHLHSKNVIEAIEKKARKILVEKPFSLNYKDSLEAYSKAKEFGVELYCTYNFLYLRSYLEAKKIIQNYGGAYFIKADQWSGINRDLPTWINEPKSSIFFDESPHLFYLGLDLCGDLRLTQKVKLSNFLSLSYSSSKKIDFVIEAIEGSPQSKWEIVVFCKKGIVTIDLWNDLVFHSPTERFVPYFSIRRLVATSFSRLKAVLDLFLNRIINGRMMFGTDDMLKRIIFLSSDHSKSELLNIHDGREVVRLIEEALS